MKRGQYGPVGLARGLGDVRLLRQQPVAVDDGGRDVGELGVCPARLVAQHLEGVSVVDRMTLHQDALGSLGDRAAAESALKVVVLGESSSQQRKTSGFTRKEEQVATIGSACARHLGVKDSHYTCMREF
jgi:hypothetical protein